MGKILVTGGLGYIGSHTVVELIQAGYEPLVIDNLSESDIEVKGRIEQIVGKEIAFEQVEMCHIEELEDLFTRHDIDGVIHFAAFLLVNESVSDPLKYYHNNLLSTTNLLRTMLAHEVYAVVFSSSCTVYGNPDQLPVTENAPIQPAVSPYGNTKKIGEDILKDTAAASDLKVISLRYFNPIGAHESALIGEFQDGEPHHLVPYITETAFGVRKELKVFGDDYNTPDGSCVRDYIHVVDVARAHISAVQRLMDGKAESFEVYNLGTGVGVSVLDMIKAFKKATGIEIPYSIAPRREGDVEAVYADTAKANKVLGWNTQKTLEDAMGDAWRWENTLRKDY
ncbi:MAG: UDP-glucose 4-epimerase GalE [Owenweeksia sp.]